MSATVDTMTPSILLEKIADALYSHEWATNETPPQCACGYLGEDHYVHVARHIVSLLQSEELI